jgi:hypothetical protein
MPDLIYKQAVAVIDERTTIVCLNVAGQIRKVGQPFDTLNGALDAPPFHYGCRAIVEIYLPGTVNVQRELANAELKQRPVTKRDPSLSADPGPAESDSSRAELARNSAGSTVVTGNQVQDSDGQIATTRSPNADTNRVCWTFSRHTYPQLPHRHASLSMRRR